MFLVNEGENSVTTNLRLEDGHICQIWDAWNGTIKQLELPDVYKRQGKVREAVPGPSFMEICGGRPYGAK